MNEYDVHFVISGFYRITADSEDEARDAVEHIIEHRIDTIEDVLKTGVKDPEGYTTDVIIHYEGEKNC